MKKPSFLMLIGVPGAGKSTFLEKCLLASHKDAVIISSDNYIEKKAKEEGKTYNEVFTKYVSAAETNMYNTVRQAVKEGKDIIWDQTNLTAKTRAKKLAEIPKNYSKVAVVIPIPDKDELNRRLASRPGKVIPEHVMNNMINSYQPPELSEGFDIIDKGNK